MKNTTKASQLKKTTLALMVALSPSAFAYDLVIMNGRVMDPETGTDKIANVAVDNGQIVAITDQILDGDKVIDAEGLVVAPGFIDTDMTKVLSDEQKEAIFKDVPANRLGAPEEIAGTVAFLASDVAAYITGETIHVNGGMYMG